MILNQSFPRKIDSSGNSSKIVLPPEFIRQLEDKELTPLYCPEFIVYTTKENVNKIQLKFSNY